MKKKNKNYDLILKPRQKKNQSAVKQSNSKNIHTTKQLLPGNRVVINYKGKHFNKLFLVKL